MKKKKILIWKKTSSFEKKHPHLKKNILIWKKTSSFEKKTSSFEKKTSSFEKTSSFKKHRHLKNIVI